MKTIKLLSVAMLLSLGSVGCLDAVDGEDGAGEAEGEEGVEQPYSPCFLQGPWSSWTSVAGVWSSETVAGGPDASWVGWRNQIRVAPRGAHSYSSQTYSQIQRGGTTYSAFQIQSICTDGQTKSGAFQYVGSGFAAEYPNGCNPWGDNGSTQERIHGKAWHSNGC
jgi:hypothetical protein